MWNGKERKERKKERKERKKNNPKNSGHYILLQRPRAAHALRSDQNLLTYFPICCNMNTSVQCNLGTWLNIVKYDAKEVKCDEAWFILLNAL